jgi:hypothetical protein
VLLDIVAVRLDVVVRVVRVARVVRGTVVLAIERGGS